MCNVNSVEAYIEQFCPSAVVRRIGNKILAGCDGKIVSIIEKRENAITYVIKTHHTAYAYEAGVYAANVLNNR